MSISDIPPIRSSSSVSSNTVISSCGITSEKPPMNARNWSPTRLWMRYSTTRSTYSALLASVTAMFEPSGFRSIVTNSPKRSSVVVNVSSRMSVMSFSLICLSHRAEIHK